LAGKHVGFVLEVVNVADQIAGDDFWPAVLVIYIVEDGN